MFTLISKSLKTELYRKAIHLSSLWMPMLMIMGHRNLNIIVYSSLLIFNLALEYAAFRKTAAIGILYRKMFIKTLRNKEVSKENFVPSGSVYVLASALFVTVCFTPQAAAASMSVMLIADAAAAIVGKSMGVIRFCNGKSLEGTLAFFVSAFFVISFFFLKTSSVIILIVSVLATLAEFFEKELKIDDNFSIPLITGFILNLI